MDGCIHLLNLAVRGTNFTWAEALAHRADNVTAAYYLRPDIGISLMPWVYMVIVIIVHLPMVIIRVTRWEIVQAWSIAFTAFTVAITIQAYVSTRFDPAQILLWNPLILVIDAGSMAQVFCLVIEAKQTVVGRRIVLSESEGPDSSRLRVRFLAWWRSHRKRAQEVGGEELQIVQSQYLPKGFDQSRHQSQGSASLDRQQSTSGRDNSQDSVSWYRDPAILSASAAGFLFCAVVTLQLVGLAEAIKVRKSSNSPPLVSWCSPLFQPFGLAAVDSDCRIHNIEQSGNRGIGCIKVPGVWQQQWLTGTIVVTILELICELVDVLILILVKSTRKVRGAKLKRPWATIFFGLGVLGVTLIFSIMYATQIPQEVGRRVTVAMDVNGPISYQGILTNGGLRGTTISWSDGLFESWGRTYFGNPNY